MANGKNIKDEIREQKGKFKTLTFSQKVQYIWEYYRFIILAVIITVCVVVSFIVAFNRNNYETVFNVAVCDGKMTGYDAQSDDFTTEFTKYLGIDGKKKQVFFDYNYNLIQENPMDSDPAISYEKIYILAQTRGLDGYICNYDCVDYFCTKNDCFFYDLNELLNKEELEALSDKLIYHTLSDGTEVPVAVDIREAPNVKDTNLTSDHPCYGIVQSTKYAENAVDFIRYLFNL
ncbi:MAG: hypothetical protein Q4F06_08615 [Eubacteriales bacterium]|nr:hypothetical protein [Eubacteriales bacterium]